MPLRLYLFCPVIWEPLFSVQVADEIEPKFPSFVIFWRLSFNRRVSGLLSCLLILSITFLLAPHWWYSKMKFFCSFKSLKSKLLVSFIGLNFVLMGIIACACSRVKFFKLASGLNFLCEQVHWFIFCSSMMSFLLTGRLIKIIDPCLKVGCFSGVI